LPSFTSRLCGLAKRPKHRAVGSGPLNYVNVYGLEMCHREPATPPNMRKEDGCQDKNAGLEYLYENAKAQAKGGEEFRYRNNLL